MMKHNLRSMVKLAISALYEQSNKSYKISQLLSIFLIIQKSLLEFSFIFANYHNSTYIQLLVIIPRPQTFLTISNLEFLYILWAILYFAGIFYHYSGIRYVALYVLIFRTALFQFIFEQLSISYLKYFLQFLLCIQLVLQLIYNQETLNIRTKNLEYTQVALLDVVVSLFDIILLFIQTQCMPILSIQLIAIINSVLKATNQFMYSPYKSYGLNVIVSSIYVITIIKAITAIAFQLDNDCDILVWPFVVVIIWQINRKKILSPIAHIQQLIYYYEDRSKHPLLKLRVKDINEQIIYSSIYFDQKELYYGFYQLKQIKECDLTFFQVVQRNCLLKYYSQLICEIIHQEKNSLDGNYKSFVEAFQNMESYFQEIQDLIEATLIQKIKCLQRMQEINHQQINDYIISMEQILSSEKIIQNKYLSCQTSKIQSVLGFYYVEIMNDFLAAASLFRIDNYSEERINHFQIDSKLITDDVSFVVSKLDHDLIIKRCSSNIQTILKHDFKYLEDKSIKILIPSGIKQVHDDLIKDFMAGGPCKFYNNFNNNILLQDSHLQVYTYIDFCINLYFTDDIYFISLFQSIQQKQLSIILSKDFKITAMSQQFIESLELQKDFQQYYNLPINTILPIFKTQISEQFQFHQNQDLFLLSLTQSITEIKFNTSYQVQYREIKAIKEYFILSFEFFKKVIISNKEDSVISQQDSIGEQNLGNQISEGPLAHSPLQLVTFLKDTNPDNLLQGITQVLKGTSENGVQIYNSPRSQDNLVQQLFSPQRSQNSHIDCQQVKSEVTDGNMNGLQDNHYASSYMSSFAGIHNSKYFKKYDLAHKIGEHSKMQHYHRHLMLFILLFMSLLILLQSIVIIFFIFQCLYLSIFNLNRLIVDLDLLQITNFIFAPLEDVIILKSQLVNYKILYLQKQLTLTQFNQLNLYPNMSIGSAFYILKSHTNSLLDRYMLQNFLENSYITVSQQISTNQSQLFNVTVRNSVNILLNFQYMSANQLQEMLDQGLATDKTFTYYTLKNIIPIKFQFQELEDQVERETLHTCSNIQSEHQILFIVEIVAILFQILFATWFYKLILIRQKQYFKLFFFIQNTSIKQDINKCNYLLQSIKKNPENLYGYSFSLNSKDKWIDQNKHLYQSERKREFKIPLLQLLNWQWTLFLGFIFFIIWLNCFLTYISLQNYLNQYPGTISLYRRISILGVDLPTLYSRRENYQYRSIFPYFDLNDEKAFVSDMLIILSRMKEFSIMKINLQKQHVENIKQPFSVKQLQRFIYGSNGIKPM